MKIKHFHVVIVVLMALSIFSGLFVGDVSQARAQSSRVWSDPINLSNSGGASNPVLGIDTLGVKHVFWLDESDGYQYTESQNGTEWTLPKTVKFPFDTEGTVPKLIPGQNGSMYVFWQNRNKSLGFAQILTGTFDQPSSWGSVNTLSDDMLVFDAAVDAQGVLHVAYIRNATSLLGPAGVYYTRSPDGGRSWSDEKLLYESQYFRTTKLEDAHVRVDVSDEAGNGRVFVAWDNTSQKRIFMSASEDSGSNWSEAIQLKGPEDTGGYNAPFNVELSIVGGKSLMIWKVGEPGATQCAVYSQWSTDWGVSWSDPDVILDYRSICPQDIDFLIQQEGTVVTLLNYAQGNPYIVAWTENNWSTPQIQSEISLFSNPETHETIMFGCHNYFVREGQLYLVGCDLGTGGDIWLASRSIAPVANWLFPSSLWDLPSLLTSSTSQTIPSMVYVPDQDYVHAIWIQLPVVSTDDSKGAIYYSRWNETQWSPAKDVVSGVKEISGQLSATASDQGRLLLAWSDEMNGDLLFTWSNSAKADSSAEWESPKDLPSPSQWTSSPDILVDASGTIAVVYAVPLNEKRGIYMVKSVDNGITWSAPVSVFDAEAAGWVRVDHPKIALTGDGKLHVLFTNYSGLASKPGELYYSQSSDGGTTWSPPDIVSDGSVVWSDIVSYDELTVHRIWQQDNGSVVSNTDQLSTDGGVTWGKAVNITGVSDMVMPVAIASNSLGELHLIQLVEEDTPLYLKEYNMTIQDWRGDGKQWESQPFQEINIKGDTAQYSLAAGISSQGFLSVSLIAEYRNLSGEIKNEIYNVGRSLSEFNKDKTPFPALIPISSDALVPTPSTDIQPASSTEPTPFPDLSDNSPSVLSKNIVGIVLILIVVGLTVFIFLRRAKRSQQS